MFMCNEVKAYAVFSSAPQRHASWLSPGIFYRAAIILVFSLSVDGQPTTASISERAPNFILILTDDLGYGDLGCYGAEKIKTPNIDRMAAEGIRLTQHYCGNADCAQSRCVLMTVMQQG